jgi:hypothetical protein
MSNNFFQAMDSSHSFLKKYRKEIKRKSTCITKNGSQIDYFRSYLFELHLAFVF